MGELSVHVGTREGIRKAPDTVVRTRRLAPPVEVQMVCALSGD